MPSPDCRRNSEDYLSPRLRDAIINSDLSGSISQGYVGCATDLKG